MENLLQNYSVGYILLFLFTAFTAIKAIWLLIEFFYEKIKGKVMKDKKAEDKDDKTEKNITECNEKLDFLTDIIEEIERDCRDHFEKQDARLDLLTDSDRDDIKSYIVKEYHHFYENKKWIDDFSLDAIEKRYKHYVDEGGNSYVETLMDKIRSLPTTPPKENKS